MNSRENILERVRAHLNRDSGNALQAGKNIDDWLAAKNQGPRPQVDAARDALVARFAEKSRLQDSTVDFVDSLSAAPAAVARYLASLEIAPRAVCWPQIATLDWAAAGIDMAARGALAADTAGVTGCFCAVAETGTLMLLSGPDTPATVSLLPETHIALVPAARIVPGMEEAWALLRAQYGGAPPRAVNFISGPSRTGDIEQTIVLGAHGPARVHLVVVNT